MSEETNNKSEATNNKSEETNNKNETSLSPQKEVKGRPEAPDYKKAD